MLMSDQHIAYYHYHCELTFLYSLYYTLIMIALGTNNDQTLTLTFKKSKHIERLVWENTSQAFYFFIEVIHY